MLNEATNVLVLTCLQRQFPGLLNLVSFFLPRAGQMDLIFNEFLLSTRHFAEHFIHVISCLK